MLWSSLPDTVLKAKSVNSFNVNFIYNITFLCMQFSLHWSTGPIVAKPASIETLH